MSHWQSGKLQLKCSMAVLKRALVNIIPEWENHIQEDINGNLSLQDRAWGEKDMTGFNLIIKIDRKDVGFKQDKDGSWIATYDSYILPRKLKSNLEGELLQEISAMRAKAIAQSKGFQLIKDDNVGNERIIEMLAPIS